MRLGLGLQLTRPGAAAAGVWTTVFTGGSTANSVGWSGWAMRQSIPASAIIDVNGSKIRPTIRSAASNGLVVGEAWFGLKGVGDWDFSGTPVQMTFDGGSTTASRAANTDLVADPITLPYTGTVDLELFYFFSGTTDLVFYNSMTGAVNGQKNSNDHATAIAAGYSTTIGTNVLKLLEVLAP